jgi:hypothetical protein
MCPNVVCMRGLLQGPPMCHSPAERERELRKEGRVVPSRVKLREGPINVTELHWAKPTMKLTCILSPSPDLTPPCQSYNVTPPCTTGAIPNEGSPPPSPDPNNCYCVQPSSIDQSTGAFTCPESEPALNCCDYYDEATDTNLGCTSYGSSGSAIITCSRTDKYPMCCTC